MPSTARNVMSLCYAMLFATAAFADLESSPLPSFQATSLTGKSVTTAQLIGQPTILIVTPSKDAATDTREWAQALRKNVDQKAVRIRDVLAVDLPFFMSEADAIGRAKEKIPARYYDQTWIFAKEKLETALGIPVDSHSAFVFVLNSQGKVLARVEGAPTSQSVGKVESAVRSM